MEVCELLDEFQLEGKWLEFEITENSLMKHEEFILQSLFVLKSRVLSCILTILVQAILRSII